MLLPRLCRSAAALSFLWLPGLAGAHPYLDILPFPPASVPSGSSYVLALVVYPGDTPIQSLQLDFELSAPTAFGPPSAALGTGFTLVYDAVADPRHFSIVGDFSGSPLEEFGIFPVADVTMLAGLADGTLSMLDSSVIVALEGGVPEEFPHELFSNLIHTDEVAHVVPEPEPGVLLAVGGAAVGGLSRFGRGRRAEA